MPCLTCDCKSVSVFNKLGVNISHFFTCELLGNYLGNSTCVSSRYLKFNVCEIEFTFLFPIFPSLLMTHSLSSPSLLPVYLQILYAVPPKYVQNFTTFSTLYCCHPNISHDHLLPAFYGNS